MTDSTSAAPRRRRKLWFVLGGLAVAILAAALVIPHLINIENYRGRIQDAIQASTGWEAELGKIELSVLRGMVLTVEPARLSAPGESSSLEIASILIKAELLPLISGKLNLRAIELVDPEILVVRNDEQEGWVVPIPPPGSTEAEPLAEGSEPSGFEIAIDSVRVKRGLLRIEDRAANPPLLLQLADLSLDFSPRTGDMSGSGLMGEEGGRLDWRGNLGEGLELELAGLPTELLHHWIGPDLVHAGGGLSGDVQVRFPLEIEGTLRGQRIKLLSGERPFEGEMQVGFLVKTEQDSWRLERFELEAEDLRLTGQGTLLPDVGLGIEMPATPLAAVLTASEAVLPLPLDISPPGTVEARITVQQPAGGDLSYEAEGALSAARFKIDDTLPIATDVKTSFGLNRAGLLEVRILDGMVGGGPLQGTARIDPIYPPGKLTFDGGLRDAVLGQLLGGLVVDAAKEVRGPTGMRAAMGVNLASDVLDARALSGRLELDSRDVSLPGWDLEGAIRSKIEKKLGSLDGLAALLGKQSKKDSAESTEQLLEVMTASIDFDSWPWNLERLELAAEGLTAKGSGTFDPLQGLVDIELVSLLDKQRTAELVKEYSELKLLVDKSGRLSFPAHVSGPLLGPSIKADLGQVAARNLTDDKDKLKGLVKGLLNRD